MPISSIPLKFHLSVVIIVLVISCQNPVPEAEIIFLDANIWTGTAYPPRAQAMAISGDTLVAVGSNEEIIHFRGENTEVIRLNDAFVSPGFIDGHVHAIRGGFGLSSVQLRDAATPEEFIGRISEFAGSAATGSWITGGRWDGSNWEEVPDRSWIDAYTPDHPVFITRLDGHMGLANSLALHLAGIDENTPAVEGGLIVRDANGRLTGILKDNAMVLVTSKIPPLSDDQIDQALQSAMNYFASQGITSVHNMWYSTDGPGDEEAFRRAHDQQTLITRIYDLGALEKWSGLAETIADEGKGDSWLRTGGVKGIIDGSLGSRTALFMQPFLDDPSNSGLRVLPNEVMMDRIMKADNAGLQVAIHAIGDLAIHDLLDMFSQVKRKNPEWDRRFRVEHAQHIAQEDVERFRELDVIASGQPYNIIDDGCWAESVIGPERIKTTYAFRSYFDTGARVAFGSDWPVNPASPLLGIFAAVTRWTKDGKNPEGWVPEQKISVEQALIAYTRDAAYASFEENIKGTLEPGKLADFVVISEDLTKIDPLMIREVRILQTYVGGKKVFDHNQR